MEVIWEQTKGNVEGLREHSLPEETRGCCRTQVEGTSDVGKREDVETPLFVGGN